MKKKLLAKNPTEFASMLNKIEGLRHGLSRADFRKMVKLLMTVETAIILDGKYRSLCYMLRAQAKRKANAKR